MNFRHGLNSRQPVPQFPIQFAGRRMPVQPIAMQLADMSISMKCGGKIFFH